MGAPSMTDIDDFFPGSKLRRDAPYVPPPSHNGWDVKSFTKRIGPRDVEMFTIGALSKALDRPIATLRMWIKKGYLPNPAFRLQEREIDGKIIAGRRLYTRPMIEQAIRSFGTRGLLNKPRIDWPKHKDLTREITSAWQQITADLTS